MLAEAKGANCDGVLSVQFIPGTPPDRVGIAQFTLLDVKLVISASAIDVSPFARTTAVSARLSLIPTESGPPGSLSVTATVTRRKPSAVSCAVDSVAAVSCAVDSVAATGALSAFDNSHAPLRGRSLSPDAAWSATHLRGRNLDMRSSVTRPLLTYSDGFPS